MGVPTGTSVGAIAVSMLWHIVLQFDTTTDDEALKMPSMMDKHTCESVLSLSDHSIAAAEAAEAVVDGI